MEGLETGLFNVSYIEKDFVPQDRFLIDEEFAAACDALVKTCADILVLSPDHKRVLLGKRDQYPMKGWWEIGGKMDPGETPKESCSRNIKRELRLDIDPTRFHFIGTSNNAWVRRQQPPQENGVHDFIVIHFLRLEPAEVSVIDHNLFFYQYHEEYDHLEWFDIETLPEKKEMFHPALWQILEKLRLYLNY